MKIRISEFGGISPKTNPRYLGAGGAQIALNVEAYGESLKPLKGLGTSVRTLVKTGTIQTLYRYGQDYSGDDNYWFHWAADVDVCRGQIPSDASEWTFYTGDSYPKATYNALALAGTSEAYPVTSRRLGLPAPTTALTATVTDLALTAGAARLTLTNAMLDQLSSGYPIKVSTSSNGGNNWTTATATVAGPTAPSVTLTTAYLAAVSPAYGVYVSVDGGQTRTYCPIVGVTTATAAAVTLTSTHVSTLGYLGQVIISVDGGVTNVASTVTQNATPTAAGVAAFINGFANGVVTAAVSGTGVSITTNTTGAGAQLRVSFGTGTLTTLTATGASGGIASAGTLVLNSINTHAGSLVTAAVSGSDITVTAKTSGAATRLWVSWGESSAQSLSATGTSPLPATVATAINNLANVTALVAGANVVVATDAAGSNVALKVQWGNDTWQTLVANGTTSDPGVPETRVYTYTFVSEESGLTTESAPWSSADMSSATVSVHTGDAVVLTGFGTPPAGEGWYYTKVRIYRATAGTYLYVDEITLPAVTYTDSKTADELGEVCPSLTWSPPVSTLTGLINLPNGMMAGFSGRDVYFCDPYRPYTWPAAYQQTVDYPVVGLGRTDTTLVVLTKGAPYFMQGGSPAYITVVKSDLEQACVSKRSIVSMGNAVFYASPDGLVMLAASGSKILTDAIFDRADWQALGPTTLHAYGHDGKYIAFHNAVTIGGAGYTGFVMDFKSNQFIRHNISGITAGYTDLRNDKLYLVNSSKQVVPWGEGSYLTGRWRSKVFTLPQITGFSCAQVEAETYSGVACAIYRDGVKLATELTADSDLVGTTSTRRIEGRYPFRLAPLQGRDWEIDLTVTQEIFHVAVAQAMAEIATGDEEA